MVISAIRDVQDHKFTIFVDGYALKEASGTILRNLAQSAGQQYIEIRIVGDSETNYRPYSETYRAY